MSDNKVLYVDDEPMNLLLFKKLIGRRYPVETASSGNEALLILKQKPEIQIVFSDMKMPEMNGIEFISKAKEYYKEKYYYIVSGYEVNEDINQALQSGLICAYLKKPFNLDEIFKTIQNSIV
nr:response regulator [uncultured Carboxylicivirga sp.]